MAYIDENGNITNTRPDFVKPRNIQADDIQIATPKQIKDPNDIYSSGVISFFNTSKGYGFIRDAKTRNNVFFHVNNLTYQAQENDQVSFETEQGPKGLNAVRITKKS